MAADQRKRRLSSSSVFSYGSSQDQFRPKKRPPPPQQQQQQYDFNFNSHVSLKWDDNGKRVVAKEEQVGISWRHLSSLVPTAPCGNTKLADVITVPKEVFELNDLSEVLSYEVWQSVLSEKERNYLAQFLPRGFEVEQVVEDLLSGDNFHFGNPCVKWGASLCSGDLHPDAIVHHEKSLKTNKKAYYLELQHYHENMIRSLQKLKERCAGSKDPEAEIRQMMSRSKRHAEKNILRDGNGFRSRKPEENVAAMSESLSSIADEKLYYSDNQKLSAFRDAEIQKRIRIEDNVKERHDKLVACTNGLKAMPKSKKVEKLQKANINANDGVKYMSYVKISKKQQHELVKSMKQSGSSIQTKTLNRVLGNLDSFNVKPYEMFVEEEQKRIHDYWLTLAKKDVPAALQNWRNRQSQRRQIMDSLWLEIEEKLRSPTKDEKSVNDDMDLEAQNEKLVGSPHEDTMNPQDMDGESSQGTSEHHQEDDSATQGSISDDDKESNLSPKQNESPNRNAPFNVNEEFDPSSTENQLSLQNAPLNVNEEFHLSSMENQSSMHSPPANVDKEFNPMDLNAENITVTSETIDTCSTMPEHHVASQTSEVCANLSRSESHCTVSAANIEEMPCAPVKNVWASIGLPETYHHTPATQYVSAGEPSLRHPQAVPEQPAHLIDLESDIPAEDATKDLLNRHTNHMPFFNPFPNRDRSDLLHSLIKRDNYHQEQKKTGLEFHPSTNVMLEPGQFPSHFREQLQPSFPLDNRQNAQNELFTNQNIQDNIYSDNNRYPIQGHGHFPTLNVRDWSNARISTPIQSSQLSSGELLNHNWFAGENRAHGGWSGADGTVFSSPSLGSGSSGDQSLYSVLSQCNTLHSQAPFNPVGSTEQIIPPANFRPEMAGGIPMANNTLPQMASSFDYLGGNEAAAPLKNTNVGWMSLGNQTSGLHDPSGKPFLKSWNHQ